MIFHGGMNESNRIFKNCPKLLLTHFSAHEHDPIFLGTGEGSIKIFCELVPVWPITLSLTIINCGNFIAGKLI